MIVEILTIGDEILSGNILDTNKQFLSDELWSNGFLIKHHTSVCDDEEAITDALHRAADRANIVLCTGGLGPTMDDFTIEVAAKAFGLEVEYHDKTLKQLEAWYQKRGRILKENSRKQALVPVGGRVISNKKGTAPGVYCKFQNTHFYFMPGVPSEMKEMFQVFILPELIKMRGKGVFFVSRFLKTFGSTEAELDDRLEDLAHDRTHIDNARIGFRYHFPEVTIKVSVWKNSESKARQDLESVLDTIRLRIGEYIYSENENDTLEKVAIEKLISAKKTVAVAESCTGGLVASRITDVSGASEIFRGGIVAYSNELKQKLLHVDERILAKEGAVSLECAEAMVRGIHEITGADFCAAVTGIAGPTGGTLEKPVGTVYIATLVDDKLENKKYFFPFPREMFKAMVSSVVLKKFLSSV